MDQLLLPPCNDLFLYRLYGTDQHAKDYDVPGIGLCINPGISLAKYIEDHAQRDDGSHWDSKVLTYDDSCLSIFPTLDMLKKAKRIYRYPKYAYLMRCGAYPISSLYELSDVCVICRFWQN